MGKYSFQNLRIFLPVLKLLLLQLTSRLAIAHKISCYVQSQDIKENLKYSLQILGNMTFKIREMHFC